MTLEKTWEECLRMWKWIAKKGIFITDDVDELKRMWLSVNGYDPYNILNHCFFCQYVDTHGGIVDCGGCIGCPGQKIVKDFCCQDYGFHWYNDPQEFYERLVTLNKIRLSKRGKK